VQPKGSRKPWAGLTRVVEVAKGCCTIVKINDTEERMEMKVTYIGIDVWKNLPQRRCILSYLGRCPHRKRPYTRPVCNPRIRVIPYTTPFHTFAYSTVSALGLASARTPAFSEAVRRGEPPLPPPVTAVVAALRRISRHWRSSRGMLYAVANSKQFVAL
jgi:hypothetical protein